MFEDFECRPVKDRVAACGAHIFGRVDIDATALLNFIADARLQTGVEVSVNHIVGRAAACAVERRPTANGHFSGDRLSMHDTVDLLFANSSRIGRGFTGARLENAAEKTIVEIARELAARESNRRLSELSGPPDRRPLADAARKVARLLDPASGAVPRTFGSALVTSPGIFRSPDANAALLGFFGVPTILETEDIVKSAVVVDDEVVARPVLRVNATVDARVIDSHEAALLMADVVAFCASPWDFELDVEQHADAHGQSRAANESTVTRPRPDARLAEWNEVVQ